jgi:hypothetical protein
MKVPFFFCLKYLAFINLGDVLLTIVFKIIEIRVFVKINLDKRTASISNIIKDIDVILMSVPITNLRKKLVHL